MNIKTRIHPVLPSTTLAVEANRKAGPCTAKPAHSWFSLPVEDLSITVQCGACGKTEDVTLVSSLLKN